MLLENYIGRPLTFAELQKSPQTCVSKDEIDMATNDGHAKLLHPVKDYSQYLVLTSVYMATIATLFAVFFRTQQKRSAIDNDMIGMSSIEDTYGSKLNEGKVQKYGILQLWLITN